MLNLRPVTSAWGFASLRWSQLAATGLLLTASACNSPGKFQAWQAPDQAVQHAYTDQHDATVGQLVEPLSHKSGKRDEFQPPTIFRPQSPDDTAWAAGAAPPASNIAPATPDRKVVPVWHEAPPRVSLAGHAAPPSVVAPLPTPLIDCPPENCPPAYCPPEGLTSQVWLPGGRYSAPEYYADEYICDGGDMRLPVHYEGDFRAGLDTEDTVAEFQDDYGRAYVLPSTRVCVYAPRFAAVRSASLSELGLQVYRLQGQHSGMPVGGVAGHVSLDAHVQHDDPFGFTTRSRAGGMEAEQKGAHLASVVAVTKHVKLLNVFQNIHGDFIAQLDGGTRSIIGEAAAAAAEWSGDRTPVMVAKDDSDQLVIGRSVAADYTAIEFKHNPGVLKLVKVADKYSALQGDIVTFTIRFDNVGGSPLQSVRIVDNLSPRLEFVQGSVEATIDGRVVEEPTTAGNTLLTFEFAEPLAARTGGSISFECRVR